MRRFIDLEEDDDPILSLVNIIDVFLVLVAILLLMVAQNIPDALSSDSQPELADAQEMDRFETTGAIGEGKGVVAGTTYRLEDGTLVFVPGE